MTYSPVPGPGRGRARQQEASSLDSWEGGAKLFITEVINWWLSVTHHSPTAN